MNLALAAKITWRFIIGDKSWWKQILEAKYMNHNRTLLLRKGYPIRPSSLFWNLIKKIVSLIKEKSSRIPGNGKLIKIWKDRIMGKQPIACQENIQDLRRWMKTKGIIIKMRYLFGEMENGEIRGFSNSLMALSLSGSH